MKLTNESATDLLIAAEAHASRGDTESVWRLIRELSEHSSQGWWEAAKARITAIFPDVSPRGWN